MAQKVATASKMKSQQETTSLGQIATVTAKPGDIGPPPPGRASHLTKALAVSGDSIDDWH